jgi:uncharacterized Zn-finger protein
MNKTIRLSTTGIAAVLISSCSLPPRQAWQQIKTQGLIPYMMSGNAPLKVTPQRSYSAVATTAPLTAPDRSYATTTAPSLIGPTLPSTPPPSMLNSSSMPTATAVADLPGYVRSPFTNPPRLVDVRGMSAGSKVVCPYTQKPFLVPGGVTAAPSAPKIASSPAPRRMDPPAPAPNSNVAALTKPAPSAPVVNPTPAPTQPKVEPAPAANATPELPYGSPISGRPGFVNSPYAAKHQLVDVTGLPVGMEVKCPYTGKLFRVPPQ